MSAQPQWWGYNKEHGWVVLDREIACNTPGVRGNLLFLRCRDGEVFDLKWELWTTPGYQYAPNHLRSLDGESAAEAAAELESLQSRWPELSQALRTQYDAIVAEQRAVERRKIDAEDKAAPPKKPRRTTSRALKAVPAAASESC
jgi:hypothetical protein